MLHLFLAVGPIPLFVWQLHAFKQIELLTPLQVSQFCSGMAFYVAFIIMRLLLLQERTAGGDVMSSNFKYHKDIFCCCFGLFLNRSETERFPSEVSTE